MKCKGCREEFEPNMARKGAIKPSWCETCLAHPLVERFRKAALYNHMEITLLEYAELRSRPNCEACGVELKESLGQIGGYPGNTRCIDHDHVTRKVRGVLCRECNIGLGKLGDNLEGVRNALKYLEKHYEDLL